MSDKNLTELEWKRFAKGRNLKDAAFVKSLAELERAKTPQAQLAALADIEKQSDLLLKADKGDKELAAYLNDAGKAIDKQRKLSEFEVKKSVKEEDDEGPGALGAKMLPLLRQIAKGKDGGDALPVMVAVSGKDVVVLVARRAIGASQKKLLTEALGTSAGVKFMSGECVWEGNAHTFVLEARVSNLAKGIKAALQKQTDTRFKVRVRGADPHDVDEDGEDADGEEGQESESKSEDSPEKAHYLNRLRELEPQVTAALRALTGDVPKLKAVFGFAQGKANEGQYVAALQGLEMVAKLLASPSTVPPAPPLPPTTTIKPEAKTGEPEGELKKFTERVNALLPRIKDGLAAGLQGSAGAKVKLSEAAVFTRKQDWLAANALLDEIERDLNADAPPVPPELSPEELRNQEHEKKLKDQRDLDDRKYQVDRSTKKFEEQLNELRRTDKKKADILSEQLRQVHDARSTHDLETAEEILSHIDALMGSAESRRAELMQMSMRQNPSYKQSVDEQNARLTPEERERFRQEAAQDGYGLTSDGMTRYALPISAAEWQERALAPLPTLAQLLEQAALKTAQDDGGAEAALPLIEQIGDVQHPLRRITERAHQYAVDGSFAENRRAESAALDLLVLSNDFSDAIQPFRLAQSKAKNADELMRNLNELAPTLADFPAPENGPGGTPAEQLQQALQALRDGDFKAASALLMGIRESLQRTWPEATPGEGFNEEIANQGETHLRVLSIKKLVDTALDLDILAAKKGLPFDNARAALLKLDQAARAFEAML